MNRASEELKYNLIKMATGIVKQKLCRFWAGS